MTFHRSHGSDRAGEEQEGCSRHADHGEASSGGPNRTRLSDRRWSKPIAPVGKSGELAVELLDELLVGQFRSRSASAKGNSHTDNVYIGRVRPEARGRSIGQNLLNEVSRPAVSHSSSSSAN
jgi:hypothetical protein